MPTTSAGRNDRGGRGRCAPGAGRRWPAPRWWSGRGGTWTRCGSRPGSSGSSWVRSSRRWTGSPGAAVVLASGDPGFFGIVRLLRERGHRARWCCRRGPAWPAAVRPARPVRGTTWPWSARTAGRCGPAVNVCRARAADRRAHRAGRRARRDRRRAARLAAHAGRRRGPGRAGGAADHAARGRGGRPGLGPAQRGALPARPGRRARPAAGTPAASRRRPPGGWALPDDAFEHRAGMVTKAEVRALALARLGPRPGELVWDVGAGLRLGRRGVRPARVRPRWPSSAGPTTPPGSRPTPRAHGVDVRVVAGRGARRRWPGCPRRTPCSSGAAGRTWSPRRPRPAPDAGRRRAGRAGPDRARPGPRCGPPASRSTGCSWPRPGWRALPDGAVRLAATNPITLLWGNATDDRPVRRHRRRSAGRRPRSPAALDAPAAPSWPSCPRCGRELDGAVFFLATGATVRLVAPLLADKRTDPGVVCVDEARRFAVALVGGHERRGQRAGRPGRPRCSAPSR